MNKHSIEGRKPLNNFQHCLKIMRITLFFLFFCILFSSASNSYSQKFTIKSKTASIKEVCKEIEKGSDYVFIFSDNCEKLIDKQVNVEANSKDVTEVLNAVLSSTGLTYKILDKQIVVYKSTESAPSVAVEQPDINIIQQPAKKQITGKVVDAQGDAIIGANIIEKGTSNGTVTDIDGNFTLSVENNAVLHVSYIGYITQDIPTTGRTILEIVLQEDLKSLDEVVVVAFGKMKKEAFTGSVGVMKSDDLVKAQVSNPASALAGRVAGVQLSNSSFQLGSSPSITIRGFGSISSDTEPLIVVDGMPFDGDLNLINSSDIESMTVLKDAASNALYGARGANGVIMITTKRGTSGDAKITFDSKWGYNSNGLRNYETTNSQQFYETYYKMLYNYYVTADGGNMSAADAHSLANSHLINSSSGVGPGYMVYSVPNGEDFIQQGGVMNPNATMGTLYTYNNQKFWLQADDWEKEGLQNGFRQEYNVSVSGTSNRVNYYTSLGYLSQEGIQEGSSQDRLTARVKLDYQAKSG